MKASEVVAIMHPEDRLAENAEALRKAQEEIVRLREALMLYRELRDAAYYTGWLSARAEDIKAMRSSGRLGEIEKGEQEKAIRYRNKIVAKIKLALGERVLSNL